MSNKAQRVGSRGPYSTRRMVPQDLMHTECFITHTAHTVHAINNLLCFSSVKHKTELYYKGYDSYSTASLFDPPTQNTINGHI